MGRDDGLSDALGAEVYDDQWTRLTDFLRYNPGARHRRRLVLASLRRAGVTNGSVLDVGCGLGEMIDFLADAEPRIQFTGVDFSSVAIDRCRERRPEFDWIVHDVTSGPIPGSFDAVICSEVLEHLEEPRAAVQHLAAAVKPDGFLILTVPHGRVYPTEREFGHVRHPERGELEVWTREAGLSTVSSAAWGFPAYALLKRLANIRPDVALERLGYGTYSPTAKAVNNVAYWATAVGSLPNSRRGVQTVHLSRRSEAAV